MKGVTTLIFLLLTGFSGAFAQHLQSENTHKNNPYYSTTDTTRLKVSNVMWKQILPPAAIRCVSGRGDRETVYR